LIKPSKDSEFSLVSKTELEPKNGRWGVTQGQIKRLKVENIP